MRSSERPHPEKTDTHTRFSGQKPAKKTSKRFPSGSNAARKLQAETKTKNRKKP
jgi:hypothetical protein